MARRTQIRIQSRSAHAATLRAIRQDRASATTLGDLREVERLGRAIRRERNTRRSAR